MSNRTKKIQTGGAVKVNFAYTSFAIESGVMNTLPLFSKYIRKKSKACDCISTPSNCGRGLSLAANTNMGERSKAIPVITGPQKLIIAIKYNLLSELEQNPRLLETPAIQESILGHCILDPRQFKSTVIVGIYDVCSHKPEKRGYGSVLFNIFINAIKTWYSQISNIMWLGIRLDNANFSKVLHIYTSLGFKDPLITKVDPFGNELPFYFLMLSRLVSKYIPVEYETTSTFNESTEMRMQLKSLLKDPTYVSSFTFKLDKFSILNLRLYPYLSDQGTVAPIHQGGLHREYFGHFGVYSTKLKSDKSVLYTLSIETDRDQTALTHTVGEADHVDLDKIEMSSFTYHTHPITQYVRHQVLIGTPSGFDFYFCIKDMLNRKIRFHMVSSIEGIYIISLKPQTIIELATPEGIQKMTDFMNKPKLDIVKMFEYPFELRKFDWLKGGNTLDEDQVAKSVKEYINFVDSKPISPLSVQFIPWNKLLEDTELKIHYPTFYLNSFVGAGDESRFTDMYDPRLLNSINPFTRDTSDVLRLGSKFLAMKSKSRTKRRSREL